MQVLDLILALQWEFEYWDRDNGFEEPAVLDFDFMAPTLDVLLSSGAVSRFLVAHPGTEAGAIRLISYMDDSGSKDLPLAQVRA